MRPCPWNSEIAASCRLRFHETPRQPEGRLAALLLDVLVAQPGLEFDVIDDHLFQHGIQHILRTYSDEPGIVFEEFAGALFEPDFPLQDDWLFRNSWHSLSPFSLPVPFSFLSLWRRGQNTRRCLCADGRERPHGSLSRPKGRKAGSLPPNSVFWPRRFSLPSLSHLFVHPWLVPFSG